MRVAFIFFLASGFLLASDLALCLEPPYGMADQLSAIPKLELALHIRAVHLNGFDT